MRRISTPKRLFALTLSAGILADGLVLSSTTISTTEPATVTASAPQAHSADDTATTGRLDRFERD